MEFQVPRITHEEVDEQRGMFVIEPLDRGFGYTFGNSLRRVLLSSLEGAAVTSVKIEGVAHEFTTLPGVREDVIDIILNLKSLICRLHGESPEVEVRLEKKGPGVVDGRRHRGARRPRDPEPGPRDREPLRQGPARDDADDRPRARLRPGRAATAAPSTRSASSRSTRSSRPFGGSRTRSRRRASASAPTTTSSRSTSRPTARSTPKRLRSPRPPRSSSASSRSSPTSTRSRASARPAEAESRGAPGARDGELPDRGARARRPQLQLPQARRHRDDRRPGLQDGERARRDPELRQEVDRRGQGDARRPTASRSGTE